LEWMAAVLVARLALTVQLVAAVFGLRRRAARGSAAPGRAAEPQIAGSAE